MKKLNKYTTLKGEVLLYIGTPDFELLESLSEGPGDLWHSSLQQGFEGIFPELVYQTAVFWWYLNDLPDREISVNWRINPNNFVVRKRVWDHFDGFSSDYSSDLSRALDFGYRMLRFGGAVPLFVDKLFPPVQENPVISDMDRYTFYLKNFKNRHSWYMCFREMLSGSFKEYSVFQNAKGRSLVKNHIKPLPARALEELAGEPSVDVVIPTMYRQEYTLQLLNDYKKQTYLPNRVIVIDATPKEDRSESIYQRADYPFELIVKWQRTSGSCRARNEAIALCRSDYIVFADDDTRILPDFIENHLRFLQTYKINACTGLDIQASNYKQDLDDLREILRKKGKKVLSAGAAQTFNNANSFVKRSEVKQIVGNDINFDGGYGEDADFGFRLIKNGEILMFNPYSVNLHLKPPAGGYRFWGMQSALTGKKRTKQPWELERPVGRIRPVPSPTIVYGILKHFKKSQLKEYKYRYLFLYLTKNPKLFPIRFLKLPLKIYQFKKTMFYAENLIKLGERFNK
ncbi:glycosyltransferase [uncultured Christiangramia sp.]|uniref:glycosyltransferase family 2 protein n=1 Tax=uncultured Christiangramia sp. TaxID=503836 RepID=UPI00262DE1B6|nr:glycosyltransferase [uncultured Christiangramia sp.]